MPLNRFNRINEDVVLMKSRLSFLNSWGYNDMESKEKESVLE